MLLGVGASETSMLEDDEAKDDSYVGKAGRRLALFIASVIEGQQKVDYRIIREHEVWYR